MRKNIFLSLAFAFLILFLGSSVWAHPGNTATDGCHYCRTNCDKWGVPWNERHCHGGGSIQQPPTYIPPAEPTNASIPWPTWTPQPLPTWTPMPPTVTPIPLTPTEQPTNTPEPTTEVLGAKTEPSPTPIVQSTSGSSIGGLLSLLLIGGSVGWFLKRRKTQPPTQ